jgi:hypothetical protein
MVPQAVPPPSSTVFPAQDARLLHYQDVLAKMSAKEASTKPNQFPADNTQEASDGWLSDEDEVEEMKTYTPVKSEGVGPLLLASCGRHNTLDDDQISPHLQDGQMNIRI